MYRKGEYDEIISKKMQNPLFAQTYILEFMKDEEFSIEEILKMVIRRIGTTEFSKLVKESKSNVTNFLNGKRTLKELTLNKYLKPFKLKVMKKLQKVA